MIRVRVKVRVRLRLKVRVRVRVRARVWRDHEDLDTPQHRVEDLWGDNQVT